MRHLFIVFLIVLLPLRGWASDAMATEMIVSQVQEQQHIATKLIAEYLYETGAKAYFYAEFAVKQLAEATTDCADHFASGQADADAAHCESCSACQVCQVCQVCHTVALPPAPALTAFGAFSLDRLPPAEVAQFTSAQAARGQKPPIF